ncbi:MAG: putative nucleotide-diphospho-sugar transferase [Leptospirales bacterium]
MLSFNKKLKKIAGAVEKNNTVILVFGNLAYSDIVYNWVAAAKRIGVNNYIIIALDNQFYQQLQKNKITSILYKVDLNRKNIWVERTKVLIKFLESGYDIIHSDADAVWLKDPCPDFFYSSNKDFIFSQGTVWPPDIHEKWGFVLCCGLFYVKSNIASINFMKDYLKQTITFKDDQVACNRLFYDQGITWQDSAYKLMNFKNKKFKVFENIIVGTNRDISVALLPQKLFQRLNIKHANAYVKHILSPKNSKNTKEVLKMHDCYFLDN